jgi:hypothetical protein
MRTRVGLIFLAFLSRPEFGRGGEVGERVGDGGGQHEAETDGHEKRDDEHLQELFALAAHKLVDLARGGGDHEDADHAIFGALDRALRRQRRRRRRRCCGAGPSRPSRRPQPGDRARGFLWRALLRDRLVRSHEVGQAGPDEFRKSVISRRSSVCGASPRTGRAGPLVPSSVEATRVSGAA